MRTLLRLLIPLPAIIAIAASLLLLEGDFLWKMQEQNLFLCTWLFFREQMVVPGGLLTWAGTFFTQFLYHPWMGVTMLAAWWMLLTWLLQRTFHLDGWRALLTVIPVLFILVTIVGMGYWIYILKLRGHFFLTTIGATAVTALLWALRKSVDGKHRPLQGTKAEPLLPVVAVMLACAVGYPLLGIYGLAATWVFSIWIWRLEPRRGRALATSAAGVASVIIVPLLCYRNVFYQTNIDNIYFAALPLYFIREEYQEYYVPFYLLLLFFVLMAALPQARLSGGKPSADAPAGKDRKGGKATTRHALWEALAVGSLLLAAIAYTVCYWDRDENFHHELAMQHSIEQLDWEGVLREAAAQEDEPTRAIVMMRNIALARLGRQGDEMYRYKNGSKRYDAPFDMRMMLVNGPLVYYHYGLVNGCYRLNMEMGVEYDWRAGHLKDLARCAVLNGEWQLARKFIGLLKQTIFFAEWADSLSRLIGKPEDIAQSKEMGFITHMMHYDSQLTSDQGYVEEFLMKRLSASTYSGDPVFQEQALLASLYTRDAKMFWHHLADYVKLHPNDRLPLHVQEAAILLGAIEGLTGMDTWPIDDNVRSSFQQFHDASLRMNNMEVGTLRKALGPQFSHTYYYEYYLMNDLPQY